MSRRYKFISYHPYFTYGVGDVNGKRFVKEGGKPSIDNDLADFDDVLSLWLLGKEAYSVFPPFENLEDFDDVYKHYLSWIDAFREIIRNKSGITFISASTREVTKPDFDRLNDNDILNCIMGIIEQSSPYVGTRGGGSETALEALKECFLFSCLKCIDDAIMTAHFGTFGGIHYAIEAANAFANYKALESKNTVLQKARSELALRALEVRHAENRARKQEAFDWLNDNRKSYASDDKTAEAMMPIFSVAFTTARDWIRGWKRG